MVAALDDSHTIQMGLHVLWRCLGVIAKLGPHFGHGLLVHRRELFLPPTCVLCAYCFPQQLVLVLVEEPPLPQHAPLIFLVHLVDGLLLHGVLRLALPQACQLIALEVLWCEEWAGLRLTDKRPTTLRQRHLQITNQNGSNVVPVNDGRPWRDGGEHHTELLHPSRQQPAPPGAVGLEERQSAGHHWRLDVLQGGEGRWA
mmetsp:Transcript_29842/g.86570  ORF Transcript_29842/g.86570 Transcript_29842/m.86570 type:complete len:200 (+) Transcript_29842:997-1596(+)